MRHVTPGAVMTENTWPFQIAPSNSPPAARTKRKFPPCRADPPRAAWRRTMIPDKSDRGKGTNHTGTQHLCAHTGINVQFGAVFLGRRLSQQRGASKRRTLILQGGGGSAAALFSMAARQNRRGCFDIGLQRPKKPRATEPPFIPSEKLKSCS